MKVHGCGGSSTGGKSPPHYDSDGEESNTSSTGSISVANGATSPLHQAPVPGTTNLSDWYVCQSSAGMPTPPSNEHSPVNHLNHFNHHLMHHQATAY